MRVVPGSTLSRFGRSVRGSLCLCALVACQPGDGASEPTGEVEAAVAVEAVGVAGAASGAPAAAPSADAPPAGSGSEARAGSASPLSGGSGEGASGEAATLDPPPALAPLPEAVSFSEALGESGAAALEQIRALRQEQREGWRAEAVRLAGSEVHPALYAELAAVAERWGDRALAAAAHERVVALFDGVGRELAASEMRLLGRSELSLGRGARGLELLGASIDAAPEAACEVLFALNGQDTATTAAAAAWASGREALSGCPKVASMPSDWRGALERGGWEAVRPALDWVVERGDERAGCRTLEAVSAAAELDVVRAEAWLDTRADALAGCEDLPLVRAGLSVSAGRAAEAVTLLQRELLDPPTLQQLDALAWAMIRAERYEEAAETYRRRCAIECDSTTRGNLVWAQSFFHQADEAIPNRFLAEANADPADTLLQFETGVMLHYWQRYDESQVFLDRARAVWPDDPRVLLYSAMNDYRSGRFEQAREGIEFAIANASSQDPDLYYCRAVIYRNVDLQRAIDDITLYRRLSTGVVPPQKSAMTAEFLRLMHEELERRSRGEAPRAFADPELGFFGEPPGSPGLAADAIRVEH